MAHVRANATVVVRRTTDHGTGERGAAGSPRWDGGDRGEMRSRCMATSENDGGAEAMADATVVVRQTTGLKSAVPLARPLASLWEHPSGGQERAPVLSWTATMARGLNAGRGVTLAHSLCVFHELGE